MEYYTTTAQELKLKSYFESLVETYRATHPPSKKWDASMFVKYPVVVFIVRAENTYLKTDDEEDLTPLCLESGGRAYLVDRCFFSEVESFRMEHNEYTVTFNPEGKYGRNVVYFADGATPATFLSSNGNTLIAEDENKYDLIYA